ncbi:MAG TPA: hypothetical protein DCQ06_02330, partial [Myxococcales bacterium]|nr:hypothetical protein [Myxococcales bacterium]
SAFITDAKSQDSTDPRQADTSQADSTPNPGDVVAEVVSADSSVASDTTTGPDTVSADVQPAADTSATDTASPQPTVVRFAALGDVGTASSAQYAVGKALGQHCKANGCDFVLLLGDNFYDTGVKDKNDQQFVTKFEKPYADVDAPFYVVLGNHDYGAGGAGAEFMKKDHYIDYGKKNPKWVLPDAYWDKQFKHVHLFAMDSNAMMFSDVLSFIVKDQIDKLDKAISQSTAQWKIAFAHHPVRSNGPHGNAGCYEGAKAAPIKALCGLIPVASGKGVLEAYDKLVCGRMDMHFAGHDHGLQWLDKTQSDKHCKGVELIISGGGAKTTSVATKSKGGFEFNPVHWQNATTPGFFYAEIKDKTLTGSFVDMNGKVTFTRTYTK